MPPGLDFLAGFLQGGEYRLGMGDLPVQDLSGHIDAVTRAGDTVVIVVVDRNLIENEFRAFLLPDASVASGRWCGHSR